MPAPVSDLLQGKAKLVSVDADEALGRALAQMVRHDYSQLPVVDGTGQCVAILTSNAIARTLNNFGVAPEALRVFDAMDERIVTCRDDDDLLDVIDDLQRSPAVLVLSSNEALVGILTNYDTTEYFRRRAQDIMLVQDIEETIKDYSLAAFKDDTDQVDRPSLGMAIEAITPSNSKELRSPFSKALARYLELCGTVGSVDSAHANTSFQEHLLRKDPSKPFERLSLNDYIEMLVSADRWPRYEAALRIKRDALRRLLAAVRETRNDLAHFRSDISEQQRDELRFCRDWLARHELAITGAFAASSTREAPAGSPGAPVTPGAPSQSDAPGVDEVTPQPLVSPLDEADLPDGSRYGALNALLRALPATPDRVVLSFADIEKVIGGKLPASAREHRSWWGNSAAGHAQSKQWLDAGWRVASVNSRGESVTFQHSKEREDAYIAFYSKVLKELRDSGANPLQASPSGTSWLTFAVLPESGPRLAYFNFSFARTKRLRVELYIDGGDSVTNKSLFDSLASRRSEIESALAASLNWERLDSKRASRVAMYLPGAITDDRGLVDLAPLAATSMLRFQQVMRREFFLAIPGSAPRT